MFKDLRNLLARWMGTKSERVIRSASLHEHRTHVPLPQLLTLEIFSHSFYKNLDDTSACADVLDNDVVVCFELPCNSQQGRAYKRQPDDPFILPLFLSEVPSNQRFTYGRSIPLFGYPSIVVIDKQQATDLSAMHEAVVERLQRWTANAKNLYTWEVAASSTSAAVDEVPIQITGPPPKDSITEIKENGDVVTVEEPMPEEGDIADEKAIIVQEEGGPASMDCTADGHDTQPRKLHAKKGIFALRLQSGHKEFGTTSNGYGPSISRFERWDERLALADSKPMLLRLGDAFVCEFDENMKAFFFGDDRSRWEHARWDTWEDFYHPEYQEAKMAANALKTQGISLQDCLAEFTKEEQLGEDDLWYCPRCKKHQQATKKFDLWKAPDILVVHLKRFSNSRMLRDKIDTFVDFPLYNLDLTELVEERKVAQNLLAEGLDIAELGLSQPDEDLVYDLYAVDEHIGGLGGGHYRAFALNHLDGKWYHFDDSFVTEARPTDAVVRVFSQHSWCQASPLFPELECISPVLQTTDRASTWGKDPHQDRERASASTQPRAYCR
jgi:ubiquitin carboxyl-terminal hydrolase 4/11/15